MPEWNPLDAGPQAPDSAYVSLQDPDARPRFDKYANHDEARKQKSEACCSCVAASVLLFCLVFFLLPRKPDLFMDKVTFDTNAAGNITGVVGKFTL